MARDLESVTKEILEINKTIAKLDPAIRGRAFEILADAAFGAGKSSGGPPAGSGRHRKTGDPSSGKPAAPSGMEEFFSEYEHDKPAENCRLISAWLYSQYGKSPFTAAQMKDIADETGITIPDRPDMTMKGAKHSKKALYRQKGKAFELTVTGEAYVKETYGVRKGNKTPPSEES